MTIQNAKPILVGYQDANPDREINITKHDISGKLAIQPNGNIHVSGDVVKLVEALHGPGEITSTPSYYRWSDLSTWDIAKLLVNLSR